MPILFFLLVLLAGFGSAISGMEKFVAAVMPAGAVHPQRQDFASVALRPFSAAGKGAPQILYPIQSHAWPRWLGAGELGGPPAIAICIDDLGEDVARTDQAMALPRHVTLSFLPFAEATPFLARKALTEGHEVLAHVPMEAEGRQDPGPMTLEVGASDILTRLSWDVARVPGLSGINNHEGSKFTADPAALLPVVRFLKKRHIFFFDSRTTPDSRVVEVARREGVMSAGRDVFLDDVLDPAAVAHALDALVAQAKKNGAAIAIGHPHEVTLRVLMAWLAGNHGVRLVPVSQAIRIKMERKTMFAGN
ncbi:MAG: divergent polysaccharide deacetylase family protein [Rhizomicrobium sp.]